MQLDLKCFIAVWKGRKKWCCFSPSMCNRGSICKKSICRKALLLLLVEDK